MLSRSTFWPVTTIWLLACCALSVSAQAHPFHTTTGEIEFNAKTGRFEIALRILTADLERAISHEPASSRREIHAIDSDTGKNSGTGNKEGKLT